MNIGRLKHRIGLLEKTTVKTSNGFKNDVWNETKKTWAAIEKQTRSREIENEKIAEENVTTFVVRYQKIAENSRIRHNEIDYTVETISDETFEKRFLTIKAKVVK